MVIINFHESNGFDSALSFVPSADGTLIATGIATPSNPYSHEDMAVVRLLPNGLPELAFAVTDAQRSSSSTPRVRAQAIWRRPIVAAEADGGIVVAGNGNGDISDYGLGEPVLARVNLDGSADTTFADGGTVWIDLSGTRAGLVTESTVRSISAAIPGRSLRHACDPRRIARTRRSRVDGVTTIDSGDGNKTSATATRASSARGTGRS